MMNIDVPDVEMDEVYEAGEREDFPPDEFEAEEERPAPVHTSDEEGEPEAKKVKTKSAAKKVVKNPQAKLDDMRLCGQKGLPLLPKTFRDVKFKGKGHEVQDLDLYLSKMEHWAHRMFPKMVFDDVIERCDRLYKTKKLVKTTLIRMRSGDNLLDGDDDVAREGDDGGFDDDIDDMEEATILSTTRPLRQEEDDEPSLSQIQSQTRTPNAPTPASAPTPPAQISDEIRERIERNKRIAMEKRLARMQAMQNTQPETSTLPVGSEETETAKTVGAAATVDAAAKTAETPSRSGHSLPTVVSKSNKPPVKAFTPAFADPEVADIEDNVEALYAETTSNSKEGDVESESVDKPVEGKTSDLKGELAKDLKEKSEDAAPQELDLEEDDLLKLINE